jgi:hypothetical protein
MEAMEEAMEACVRSEARVSGESSFDDEGGGVLLVSSCWDGFFTAADVSADGGATSVHPEIRAV